MSNEKQVVIRGNETDKAEFIHAATSETKDVHAVGMNVDDAVIKFKLVKDFTTFEAEYAITQKGIEVHFYLPSEVRPDTEKGEKLADGPVQHWWEGSDGAFPLMLTKVSMEHFQAEFPRLMAKYTDELYSWWFRANGFSNVIDPDALVLKFFDKLDNALDAHQEAAPVSLGSPPAHGETSLP